MSTPCVGDGGRGDCSEGDSQVHDSRWGLVANASAAGWMVKSVLGVQGRVFCRLSPVPGVARAERSQA